MKMILSFRVVLRIAFYGFLIGFALGLTVAAQAATTSNSERHQRSADQLIPQPGTAHLTGEVRQACTRISYGS